MLKSFRIFIRRCCRAESARRLRKTRVLAKMHRYRLYRDPLAHPHLKRMSSRELADLAFDPEKIAPD
tara:strand:- start:438 stop:638 length:201 start_codon:yes stop_codon:yes gene_type:complete